MCRTLRWAWTGLTATVFCGCVCCGSGPLTDNPVYVRANPNVTIENPVFIPQGPAAYGIVFEKIIDVLDDYFDIAYTNRYAGEIATFPKVAPGFEQPWKPGNPSAENRLQATLQTIRNRAEVLIHPAEDGGYFIEVVVRKELEDLARPIRATAGAASFATNPTVERQFEVIDASIYESNWIPQGRNAALEQLILQRLKDCL